MKRSAQIVCGITLLCRAWLFLTVAFHSISKRMETTDMNYETSETRIWGNVAYNAIQIIVLWAFFIC